MDSDLVDEIHHPYGTEITEDEVKRLISLEKVRTSDEQITFPDAGKDIEILLISLDTTEMFILSIGVGKIDFLKTTNQLRTKPENILLVRVDTGNKPHKNPDGTIITAPHIHIYKQGYGIRYAYPLEDYIQTDPTDPWKVLHDFMEYCTITKKPCIVKGVDQW